MKLEIRDNGTAHKDLFVIFDMLDVNVITDTYYFIIDNQFEPEIEDSSKARRSLINLLNYWIQNIEALQIKEIRYLPIDFSDQYTGCFKLNRVEEELIEISYGYSLREGYTVSPANPMEYATSINDYEQTSKREIITKNDLIAYIKDSIKHI